MNVKWRTKATRQAEQALQYAEVHFASSAALGMAQEINANNNRLATNPYLGPPRTSIGYAV